MATKKSTPGTRSSRNPQSAAPPPGVQFEALREHIETQRSRLMDAEAVLDCVIYAIDEDVRLDAPGPSYANVVRIVRGFVHYAIDQLDTVSVYAAIGRVPSYEDVSLEMSDVEASGDKYKGVKEAPTAYVH